MLGGSDDDLALVAVALEALAEKVEVCGMRRPPGLDPARARLKAWREQRGATSDPAIAAGDDAVVMPLLLSYRQAATRMGVSEWTVERAVRSGELPSVRLGRRVLIRPEDLEHYVAGLADHHKET